MTSRDITKALAVANGVRAGTVWVNCYDVSTSSMQSPCLLGGAFFVPDPPKHPFILVS